MTNEDGEYLLALILLLPSSSLHVVTDTWLVRVGAMILDGYPLPWGIRFGRLANLLLREYYVESDGDSVVDRFI